MESDPSKPTQHERTGCSSDTCKSCICKNCIQTESFDRMAGANEPKDPSKQWVNLLKPVHCLLYCANQKGASLCRENLSFRMAHCIGRIFQGTLQDMKWLQLERLGNLDSKMLKHLQIFESSGSFRQIYCGDMSTRCLEAETGIQAPMNGR